MKISQLSSIHKFHISYSGKIRLTASPSGASPLTLTLIDVVTAKAGIAPIIQRKAGTIYGDVPILFTYTGNRPTKVEARIIQGASTVIKNWTEISNPIIISGTGSGYLTDVLQGANYKIQIRDGLQPANGPTISNGTVPFGIGTIWMAQGQSNMVGTLQADYTYVVPGTATGEYSYYNAGNIVGSIFDDVGWHAPSNGTNGPTGSECGGNTATGGGIMFMRLLAQRMKAFYGYDVPVGIIQWAFSSTSISAFVPGGARYNTIFNNSGSSGSTIGFSSPKNVYAGDFEGVIWHQGEADQAVSQASYQASLQLLHGGFISYVANFGRTASNFYFLPAVLGNYGTTQCPSIENMRAAVANFEIWAAANSFPNAKIGWTTIDLSTSAGAGGGLHFVAADLQRRSMVRAIQSVMKCLGIATFSGRGATINTTPSRVGLVVTLSIVHEGGTALAVPSVGSAPTGFYANTLANFTGTDITPTVALINSNTQVQLTFPGGTTFPCYIKYLGGKVGSTVVDGSGYTASCNPNYSNCLYDNVTYPTGATGTDVEVMGLPVLPSLGAITIN